MKTKTIQSLTIAVVICFSLSSYLYLNYNLVPNNEQISLNEIESEVKEVPKTDEVLTELTFMKIIGKKLIEVITFSI